MENNLNNKRHTLAHLLAFVCQKKYPNLKLTIGPAIENGFYYDIDFEENQKPKTEKDLENLTNEIKNLIKTGGYFSHQKVSEEEAKQIFQNNTYKLELIDEIISRKEEITIYTINFKNGEKFIDLCRGGHVDNIEEIDPESFKIKKLAGSYWRGDEKNKMLTRIYGLAFNNKQELEEYENRLEEAKKRDHRVLGKDLNLFIFSDLVGSGLPLWTPEGTYLRNKINDYVQKLRSKYNYQSVTIPHLTKSDLYKTSGHLDKYAEDLFKINTRDGHILCLKPMNCPHHAQIYASKLRSYKELPIRYSETTMVYRDEQSGELNGLARVLSITQDDAHIFCREAQIEEEVNNIWNLIEEFYSSFGFKNLTPRFSRRNNENKFKGNPELWQKAENAIKNLLEKRAKNNWIDGEGEAAFYGPKVDFMVEDAIGRKHQVGTIQIDFLQPTNFKLEYINEKGEREMPVMIHCAIAGSLERFISVYLEHSAGYFPLWLSPYGIKVIPINNEKHLEYATKIYNLLKENNIKVELDDKKENLGKKVKEAKDYKYPYWIIIGDNEINSATITLESIQNEKFVLNEKDLLEKLLTENKK